MHIINFASSGSTDSQMADSASLNCSPQRYVLCLKLTCKSSMYSRGFIDVNDFPLPIPISVMVNQVIKLGIVIPRFLALLNNAVAIVTCLEEFDLLTNIIVLRKLN